MLGLPVATPTHQVSYTRPHLIGIALFLSCLARCKTLCTCYCHRAHRRRDPWRLKLNSRLRLGGLIIQNHESTLCSKKQVTNSETRLLLPPLGNVKWNFPFCSLGRLGFWFFDAFNLFQHAFHIFCWPLLEWVTQGASAWVNLFFTHSSGVRPVKVRDFPCWQLHRKGVTKNSTWARLEHLGINVAMVVSCCFTWISMKMWLSLKLMHMIWLRVQDGPNAQREACARQTGGILTSSQLTFGLL